MRTAHEVGSDNPVLLDLDIERGALVLDGRELSPEGRDARFSLLLLLLLFLQHCGHNHPSEYVPCSAQHELAREGRNEGTHRQ